MGRSTAPAQCAIRGDQPKEGTEAQRNRSNRQAAAISEDFGLVVFVYAPL